MEMIDREKVINGLECCIERDPDDHTRCGECPYKSTMCGNRLKIEALALLKAQQPRVMSFDEAMLDIDRDVVWIELKDDQIVEPAIIIVATNDSAAVMSPFSDEEDGALRCDRVLCGKTYRCWTSRPTDEQREATPWTMS